ncbi:MAG: sn-glycerol-3-phosphate ABC transporter ATP-binding protein UgpC, partial [Candidatus Eisenbacteria bacterium]
MAGVDFVGVGKSYGRGAYAVKDVTLTVAEGEFLVLVGPSGCGKSTLLRMVAGLEEVTDGEVRIGGRRVNEVAPRDRDVAMVFQNYALYPHMTVFDNLAFGLQLRKVAKDEIRRRVEAAAGVLGLERYLERQPRELSGGERQRVALGRAMVREPKVFLFDEPLSNLDARLRVEMRAEIRRLHQRVGATMIYVTHDQVEAMTMGDRIAVLQKGLLQQCADPRTLYSRPANTFVAGFIGTPPINQFPGVLAADGATVEVAGAKLPLGAAQQAALAGRAGGKVTLGVR